eukprot:3457591-Rhodomonas_salina.1
MQILPRPGGKCRARRAVSEQMSRAEVTQLARREGETRKQVPCFAPPRVSDGSVGPDRPGHGQQNPGEARCGRDGGAAAKLAADAPLDARLDPRGERGDRADLRRLGAMHA